MRQASEMIMPRARKNGLVVKGLNDEVLVYDLERDKAHSLNSSAAFIWKKCNGRRTVEEVAQALSKEFKVPADAQTVWLALDQLSKFHLLEAKVSRPAGVPQISRRQMMRIGAAAAFALPVIVSIVAPTAANAQSAISPSVCNARTPAGFPGPPPCGGTPCTGGSGTQACNIFSGTQCKCQ
ncbi:MAG TPA: PqqD family protein [Pyrinomonadaceae bacterium]|nr:PqqD family protein [Pyrinomonadaceae bacterium]